MNNLSKYEMIFYCLIHPILTMTFFMTWFNQTTLPGIGMAPILLGIILLIVFAIEITLVLVFRKRIIGLRKKLISLFIGFLLYELTLWLYGGSDLFAFLDTFGIPFEENIDGAVSFSSLFSLLIILGLMIINEKLTKKPASPQ